MNAIDETVELLCKKPLKRPFDIHVGELCCALFSGKSHNYKIRSM